MDMTKQLPDTFMFSCITEIWVVVEENLLSFQPDFPLITQEFECGSFLELLTPVQPNVIMVSIYQQDGSIKSPNEFQHLLLWDLTAKVSKVEDNPIFWDSLIPVPYQGLIHSFYIRESGSVLDYPCAVKMGVSCEEGVVRSEGGEKGCLVWVKQWD